MLTYCTLVQYFLAPVLKYSALPENRAIITIAQNSRGSAQGATDYHRTPPTKQTYNVKGQQKMATKKDDNSAKGNAARENIARQQREHRNATEPQQRRTRRANRGRGEVAEWGDAEPQKVVDAVSAVTKTGCAIRFGYTRDGGAYAIGIIGDGEPYTDFVRPSEDINLYLEGLKLDFENGIGDYAAF